MYLDGSVYEGKIDNGMKNGKGKLSTSDGAQYEGDFTNDNI